MNVDFLQSKQVYGCFSCFKDLESLVYSERFKVNEFYVKIIKSYTGPVLTENLPPNVDEIIDMMVANNRQVRDELVKGNS